MQHPNTTYHSKNISEKTFLVTGAAGFIGSHLVEYLLKNGAGKVIALDNLVTGQQPNIDLFLHHPNYEFGKGDLRDYRTCEKATAGVDFILHQAAIGSVPRSVDDPLNTNSANVTGFLNILEAAKINGVKRFVYASSSSVYGDDATFPKTENSVGNPLSPYAVSKKTNELYAKVFADIYGMEIIGLRYFNVFGPRQSPNGAYAAVIPLFIDKLKNDESPRIDGDGGQTRDFTFVENVVQANMKALFTENKDALNQVYNIAAGSNYSVLTLFNAIKENLGSLIDPTFGPPRTADIRDSLADISKAREMLDYHPQVDFHSGLKRTVDFFEKELATVS